MWTLISHFLKCFDALFCKDAPVKLRDERSHFCGKAIVTSNYSAIPLLWNSPWLWIGFSQWGTLLIELNSNPKHTIEDPKSSFSEKLVSDCWCDKVSWPSVFSSPEEFLNARCVPHTWANKKRATKKDKYKLKKEKEANKERQKW